MTELKPYLTVKDAAAELGMSDDGVRKLIRAGKLRAVKRSERRIVIPRPAFQAYQRKLNGRNVEPVGLKSAVGSVADRSAAFKRDAGMSPEAWLHRQIPDDNVTDDDVAGMGLTVSAFGLVSERRAEGFIDVPLRPCLDQQHVRDSSRWLQPLGLGA